MFIERRRTAATAALLLIAGCAVILFIYESRTASLTRPLAFLLSALGAFWLVNIWRKQADLHHNLVDARLIVESMPGLGWATDAQGNFVYINPSVVDYVGKSTDEFNAIGRTGLEAVHPDDADRVTEAWLTSMRTGTPFESVHRIRRADGDYSWFHAYGRPHRNQRGEIQGWYGTTIDVDEKQKAQQRLADSERQLQILIDTMPVMIWCAAPTGEPIYQNPKLLEYLGASFEEIRDNNFGVVHSDDMEGFQSVWADCVKQRTLLSIICRLRFNDGTYRWNRVTAAPLLGENGEIIQWYGTNVDIEELHQTQEELRSNAERLRLMLDTLPAFVWCASPDGQPTYFNEPLMRYSGVTLEELRGANGSGFAPMISSLVHPADAPVLRDRFEQSFRSGEPIALKYRHRLADGGYHLVDCRARVLRDSQSRLFQWYGVIVDVEDETQAQAQLQKAQHQLELATRAASLSELSASIAHEISQPLVAVLTNSLATERWLEATPPNFERARNSARKAAEAANDASEVISRIKALFRQSGAAKSPGNLNGVIEEACILLRERIAASKCDLRTDLQRDLPDAVFDKGLMLQVLVNLIQNAMDAMATMNGAARLLEIRSKREDGNIVVHVRDSGIGLNDTEKIFEPFYTTKHNGMGIGLSVCRSIVRAHEGTLWAAPSEPSGTIFSFSLPMAGGEPDVQ
ncbi:PAS domain-containing protein [Rhizobium laguerreae]|uniref:PAS domain-containing protein n=1 Tax=Rhizobium laguerreae TaxID=1076926 RepID=UPI00143F96C4|nr:PAS domain-containing protein [Rhizobium laguerreae]NKM87997.1 PAS domain-containing protein [Rhizobium laguerreae]